MAMMRSAAVLSTLAAVSVAEEAQTNPLAQVIKLCDELAVKVKADGEAEAKRYKEYFEWCDDVSKEKQNEITTATSQKESLEAKIGEHKATIEEADTKVSELAEKISTNSGDLKAATSVREKEAAEFATAEKELVETVDTLSRAIAILEKELAKGGAALAQLNKNANLKNTLAALSVIVDAASFSSTDKKKLVALVQASQNAEDEDGDEETGAPAAAAYESKSGSIVDVLNDMLEKAESQLADVRKTEATAKGNYAQLKQGLEDQLGYDNKEMDQTKANKAAAEEGLATAEGELSVTVADLKESSETLSVTQKGCMQVAADHEASMVSRAEELKVIAQAKKILEDTTNGASASFLQTSIEKKGSRSNIVSEVKALARKHHSAALAQLASRISAVVGFGSRVADPFAKIKGLIQDMIAKLEAEAAEEATEKAYCDEEMSKTTAKKEELEADLSKLTTKIDQSVAASTELKEEVNALQGELAAMAKEQADYDKVRQEDHDVYLKQKADLELALGGMRKALDVLRQYYAKGSAALVQTDDENFMHQPAPPQSHSASGGAGGSIINILEVAESDTADNLAKVETEEADEQAEYEKATQEFKVSKATKDQDVKYKTQEFTALDKMVTDLSGDQATVNTELAAVNEYDAKLKDRCVAKPETYEDRKKRRDAEIAGLKEALTTLENEAAFAQRGSKRRVRGHVKASLTA